MGKRSSPENKEDVMENEKVVLGEGEVQDYLSRIKAGLLNGKEEVTLDLRKSSANLDPDADNRGADRD